jgi:biopolymer transport protein ExbB/TolQ
MYFQFVCPSCQKSLKVREENAGGKVRCPYCHETLAVKASRPQGEPGGAMAPSDSHVLSEGTSSALLRDSAQWSASGTEVSMSRSALYAAVGVLVFFAVAWPFRDFLGYASRLIFGHGWIPYILVYLGFWSAAILFLKSRKLAKQKDSMLFDLLPVEIAEEITVRNAPQFLQHIRSLPTNPNESFLINRVVRGLEHFRSLQIGSEVADRLKAQSEIDATAVESSYTSLKVFIWAMPVLGFIGTVIGIGNSVSGLAKGARDTSTARAVSEELPAGSSPDAGETNVDRDAILGQIASGLSAAFDTTLLALAMSLLIMIPTSSMQKSEGDLLNLVDEYCNENLLKRLKDSGRGAAGQAAEGSRIIEKAVETAITNRQAELETWAKKLETMTSQVGEGWSSANSQLQTSQKEYLEQLRGALSAIVDSQQQIVARLEAIQADQVQHFKSAIEAGSTFAERSGQAE